MEPNSVVYSVLTLIWGLESAALGYALAIGPCAGESELADGGHLFMVYFIGEKILLLFTVPVKQGEKTPAAFLHSWIFKCVLLCF